MRVADWLSFALLLLAPQLATAGPPQYIYAYGTFADGRDFIWTNMHSAIDETVEYLHQEAGDTISIDANVSPDGRRIDVVVAEELRPGVNSAGWQIDLYTFEEGPVFQGPQIPLSVSSSTFAGGVTMRYGTYLSWAGVKDAGGHSFQATLTGVVGSIPEPTTASLLVAGLCTFITCIRRPARGSQ